MGVFKKKTVPLPPPPPPPPEIVRTKAPTLFDKAAGDSFRGTRKRLGSTGARTTILTGGQGGGTPMTGERKTLLGS